MIRGFLSRQRLRSAASFRFFPCPMGLFVLLLALSGALLTACSEATVVPTRASVALLNIGPPPTSPVTPPGSVPLATITPTPVPGSWRLYAGPEIPLRARNVLDGLIADQPQHFGWTVERGQADLVLSLGSGAPVAYWVYAVAGPFATVADDVALADVQAAWKGAAGTPLIVGEAEAAVLASLWGTPAESVQIVAEELVTETVWSARPSWTIRAFDQLTPDLKVLRIDGQSPLDHDFDLDSYPLKQVIGVSGDSDAVSAIQSSLPGRTTNRDPGRMTRVAMSGVTALVRATAYQMELSGILWPGEEVGPVLRAADIAHISNEVAFAPDCPPPNPIGGTTFCSDTRYFELLEDMGTDVVEVTGNHVNDWGADNFALTLDMYDTANMSYFGGGRNSSEGVAPAVFQHNGNQIAFVGCNPVGPAYAWASSIQAGSNACDFQALYAQIGELRAQGYVVIATQQYFENYSYGPTGQQVVDFAELAVAGAHAVSGSQGHHAQGFAFENGSFIHYGLGNLFFDQMDMLGTRQTFVDLYTVYEGRLLSVELWTGLIEDYARPRLMTPEERRSLLQTVFQASGW